MYVHPFSATHTSPIVGNPIIGIPCPNTLPHISCNKVILVKYQSHCDLVQILHQNNPISSAFKPLFLHSPNI